MNSFKNVKKTELVASTDPKYWICMTALSRIDKRGTLGISKEIPLFGKRFTKVLKNHA